jgi:hypothetical protein
MDAFVRTDKCFFALPFSKLITIKTPSVYMAVLNTRTPYNKQLQKENSTKGIMEIWSKDHPLELGFSPCVIFFFFPLQKLP